MLNFYRKITLLTYWLLMPFLGVRCIFEGPESPWCGRLGKVPPEVKAQSPYDVWFQAVSVGEVSVAEALVRALDRRHPGLKIIVSSTTPAGLARARSMLGNRCPVIPYPLDFPQAVRRLARSIRPSIYAPIETELWPNLLHEVTAEGAKAVLLNGRVSSRSFKNYKRIASVMGSVLGKFTILCAISDSYAQRLVELGAAAESIRVVGNAKFEGLLRRIDWSRADKMRKKLGIGKQQRVFVAGSLRQGEERYLAEVVKGLVREFPEGLFVLVPRHLQRVADVARCLEQHSLKFDLWSSLEVGKPRRHRVLLVDVIGPLFDLYSIADAAFVGGSLVPKGGQNLMEPAAWGRPVLFGPFTDNFEESRQALLDTGGGMVAAGAEELMQYVKRLFCEVEFKKEMGLKALEALKMLAQDAATRQAELILQILEAGR